LDVYVARYGDRILAEPPARGFSRLFHVAPWVFLAGSVGLVWAVLRRLRPAAAAEGAVAAATAAPPDEAESERIDEELRNLD
ncbi:MAG TPA: cytochrome c-type biogenesis protein CcmH, partial [Vicinamibacterales bacterium]|nr:cytochrome c-type biogenesis protein CcmH [Vicinamibacterales bacterium]